MSESQNASNSQLPSESSDFVGRSREMAILEAAWARAADGHGQLAMPAGEPGIGKTRTAKELAQRVQEMNGQVLWGWCYEGEGAPSYWPWVDALRAYVRRAEPELLRAQLGTGAAAISEMIPEILEKLEDIVPPPAMEPDQARFRLFDSITGFLLSPAPRPYC